MMYPVECKKRVVTFGCTSTFIDFGRVIIGEKHTENLHFMAEGCEFTSIEFQNMKGESL